MIEFPQIWGISGSPKKVSPADLQKGMAPIEEDTAVPPGDYNTSNSTLYGPLVDCQQFFLNRSSL
jgi:hypothetical protein